MKKKGPENRKNEVKLRLLCAAPEALRDYDFPSPMKAYSSLISALSMVILFLWVFHIHMSAPYVARFSNNLGLTAHRPHQGLMNTLTNSCAPFFKEIPLSM